MPHSGKAWQSVWQELENEGWLCIKHGEQQRKHYLLPLGEQCNANVRAGSYVKSITATDGSTRAVYRTRGEVEKHVRLTKGPLSTILAATDISSPVLVSQKRKLPTQASEPSSTTAKKLPAPASKPTPTTATRTGRTVNLLEAPGANGGPQLRLTSQRANDLPRTTLQTGAKIPAQSSTKSAKKQRANSEAHALRWSPTSAAIKTKENGTVASHETPYGVEAYWQTVVCSGHVMAGGRHSAQFTVRRGGDRLNVGVVDRKWSPQCLTNATDTTSGFGFDSKSGGYWHNGDLKHPAESNLEKLSQALPHRQIQKGDRIILMLDLTDKAGRLSVQVNNTNLGLLVDGIDYSSGMVWFVELCGGESIRVAPLLPVGTESLAVGERVEVDFEELGTFEGVVVDAMVAKGSADVFFECDGTTSTLRKGTHRYRKLTNNYVKVSYFKPLKIAVLNTTVIFEDYEHQKNLDPLQKLTGDYIKKELPDATRIAVVTSPELSPANWKNYTTNGFPWPRGSQGQYDYRKMVNIDDEQYVSDEHDAGEDADWEIWANGKTEWVWTDRQTNQGWERLITGGYGQHGLTLVAIIPDSRVTVQFKGTGMRISIRN